MDEWSIASFFIVPLLLLLFVILSAVFMPWYNRSKLKDLQEQLFKLKHQVKCLIALLSDKNPELGDTLEKQRPKPEPPKPAAAPAGIKIIRPQSPSQPIAPTPTTATATASVASVSTDKSSRPFNLEQEFGAKLSVWIGAIALILAGFYLVKYSIEVGMLTTEVRLTLGALFGIVLLAGGHWLHQHPKIANNQRIGQALSGSGIAILYVTLFASANIYELLPDVVSFIGMAAITMIAVLLSLKQGPAIALLGLVGGFFTPVMLATAKPSAFRLFLYLYALFSGLMVVIKRQRWWGLSIPALIGAFAWLIYWLSSHYQPADSIWLGCFILAISATIVITVGEPKEPTKSTTFVKYVGLGGALLLMGIMASESDFELLDWGLYGLLAVGGVSLAFYRPQLYRFIPWAAMAINAVMFHAWDGAPVSLYLSLLSAFAALYIVSGYVLMWRSDKPVVWAGLVVATSLSYYLLAYFNSFDNFTISQIPYLWGGLALVLAALSSWGFYQVMVYFPKNTNKESMLALFAILVTSFVSLLLTIEVRPEFLSTAIATEMLAIAWINRFTRLPTMRTICGVLSGVFVVLIAPQLAHLLAMSLTSLFAIPNVLYSALPLVHWPIFESGVPGLLFIATSYVLRQQTDGKLVKWLEYSGVFLLSVCLYYIVRHAFTVDEMIYLKRPEFLERGIISNALFLLGLLLLTLNRQVKRCAFHISGIVLCCYALFRILYFDLFMYNPLFSPENVGATPLWNNLLVTFGLPIVLIGVSAKSFFTDKHKWLHHSFGVVAMIFFWVLVSFNIRQLFQGEYLDTQVTTNAEVYAYTIVWLLMGIGLLLLNLTIPKPLLRYGSLALILLTVGKVFLVDTSQLEGLYRVFSFLGLGLSLLGISYIYSRFVFATEPPRSQGA